jgi:hypothetical protein
MMHVVRVSPREVYSLKAADRPEGKKKTEVPENPEDPEDLKLRSG